MQLLLSRGQPAYETRAEAVEDSYFQLGGSFLTRCKGKKGGSAGAQSRMKAGGNSSMLSRSQEPLHARCALQATEAVQQA